MTRNQLVLDNMLATDVRARIDLNSSNIMFMLTSYRMRNSKNKKQAKPLTVRDRMRLIKLAGVE